MRLLIQESPVPSVTEREWRACAGGDTAARRGAGRGGAVPPAQALSQGREGWGVRETPAEVIPLELRLWPSGQGPWELSGRKKC